MATINETVYLDKDNTISLILKSDGTAVDLSSVTRIVVKAQDGSFEIDSDDSPDAFNWSTGTTGEVEMSFGAKDVSACNWKNCWIIVYDETNDDGIVMNPADNLLIRFVALT